MQKTIFRPEQASVGAKNLTILVFSKCNRHSFDFDNTVFYSIYMMYT